MRLKTAVFKTASAISYGTGLTRILREVTELACGRYGSGASQRGSGPHLRDFQVLIYHRVHPDDQSFCMDTLSPAAFEAQMRFLKRSYAVLSLEEIVALRRACSPLPRKCIAISFDDGYRDNYLHAYPILAKYNLPATVFLTTEYIGTGRLLWFDQVLQAFKHTKKRALRLAWMEREFVIDAPARRPWAAHAILSHLKKQENSVRRRRIQQVFEELEFDPDGLGLELMLSWEDVRQLLGGGLAVGSHTATHPILSRVDSEEARSEIVNSKRVLERETGRRVTLFSYPNGQSEDFTEETASLVREAGYEAAVTTILKNNGPQEDLFRLGRYRPWESHLPSFALKLAYYRAVL